MSSEDPTELSIYEQASPERVVSKTDVGPIDKADPPGVWTRFVDFLRTAVGCKPIHLAERFAAAKCAQEEAEAAARMLKAKGDYELAMATVRQMDREGQSSDAQTLSSEADSSVSGQELVQQLLAAKDQTPEEAVEDLNAVIARIEFAGGSVEFQVESELASCNVIVRKVEGLHARPAHTLSVIANSFESKILIGRDDEEVDCKSILSLLALGAAPGTSLIVSAEGPDAQRAVDAIRAFFDSGFAEPSSPSG